MTSETNTMPENAPPPEVVGLLAEFDGPETLKAAAARLRDEGFTRWDVHSPFPVHGMERAMGIRPTVLPWLVLGAGITGGIVALLTQWWINAVGYPFIVSGKPLFSLPANIPITFEVIVLFSAIAAFGGALMLGRLPQFLHPVFSGKRFRQATTDGFFISVEAADPKFDRSATGALVESLGATAVELCRETAEGRRFPVILPWVIAVAITLALVPPVLIAWYRAVPKRSPRIHIIQDMDFQPTYRTQAASPRFDDGRTMRPPVPGTIADGRLEEDDHLLRGKVGEQWVTTFPGPVNKAMIERGRERFNIFCAPCHGLLGNGQGMTSIRATEREEPEWKPPTSIHAGDVRQQPVGQIFGTITNGLDKMPAYGWQVPVEDRWAIVLYVRALQRSQNAGVDDVPEEIRPQLR
jgi:mono/diheme cytochrome c family protein